MKTIQRVDILRWSLVVICFLVTSFVGAKDYTLFSPNGEICVRIDADIHLSYRILHKSEILLDSSRIGLELMDGTLIDDISSGKQKNFSETINAPFYRFHQFTTTYNELNLKMKNGFGLIFRAYNEGVAYRFYTTRKDEIVVKQEIAEFNFLNDFIAYLPYSTNDSNPMAMAYQNVYDKTPLSKASDKLVFLPAMIDCGRAKVTILESDLEAYPGMFVRRQSHGFGLKGVFAPYPMQTNFYTWRKQLYVTQGEDYIAKSQGKRKYPWRVLAISDDDRQMPVNNLVYALAAPNRIGDISWIESGKVAWDWWNDWNLKGVDFKAGINMDTYKYFIDFASSHGLEYVVLDEGWYLPKSGDMLTAIPDLDLPELVSYGHSRGVNLILWTVFNVLDNQLEQACRKYSEMGIKGFKVDFLDRDDQTAVEMVYRIAETAARYHLMLDFHGIYKPTGLNRTFPNVVNFESVFGMEEVKWTNPKNDMPLYDVTFPYIRLMAGPVDYTPGAMRNATKSDWRAMYHTPASMGTRCHQLATYIIYDSPLTMLCDAPTNYLKEEECVNFIASLPDKTDSTFIASGEVGKYIVSVRKTGETWYIGGMTNWDERNIVLDFCFLPKGVEYRAILFTDGLNANKNAEDYQVKKITLNNHSCLQIRLASGGGFAMKLDKME